MKIKDIIDENEGKTIAVYRGMWVFTDKPRVYHPSDRSLARLAAVLASWHDTDKVTILSHTERENVYRYHVKAESDV